MEWITHSWHWIERTMQNSPELAIFLTLALGFALGKVNIKGFTLGSVTGVLIMGVVVGQIGFEIAPVVKSTFFLLFLFAIGYSVGPQFVHSLKKEGIPQILFSCLQCLFCLLITWAVALIAGYDVGEAVGLLSGSSTISAVIGVATDSINSLDISSTEKLKFLNQIPVAYAVTYIFGTAGSAWLLASVGTKLVDKDIVAKTKAYEKQLGGAIVSADPTLEAVYNGTTFRVVELAGDFIKTPQTIDSLEQYFLTKSDRPIYIERVRLAKDQSIISEPDATTVLSLGDRVVLNGPFEAVLDEENEIGKEVADIELLDFRVEVLKVTLTNAKVAGKTLIDFKNSKERHGVVLRSIKRGGVNLPMLQKVTFQLGDVLEIEGRKTDVDRLVTYLGYADRPTNATDILYVALGIFIGGILGSLTVKTGSVPLSLSSSGGALIMGIVFGWYRSKHPNIGAVPEQAIWLMNNLGLCTFIAVVGLMAGPTFVSGFKSAGLSLFIAGVVVTSLPLLLGIFMGKYIFKFHPAITLGACAGSRTTTAALGAIEEKIGSQVPSLAYTTTYAVGNTLLTIWGVVIVVLMTL